MDYIFRYLALKHLDESAKHPVTSKLAHFRTHAKGWPEEKIGEKTVKALPAATEDEPQSAASAINRLTDSSASRIAEEVTAYVHESDAPACHVCGYIMVRNGACHKCENCGATSGCS